MSYLPEFMKKRKFSKCTVCVVGKGCGAVVSLFGSYNVEVFAQKELDAAVQACLYENEKDTFVAHQDRPYVVNLNRALYLKKYRLKKCTAAVFLGCRSKRSRQSLNIGKNMLRKM